MLEEPCPIPCASGNLMPPKRGQTLHGLFFYLSVSYRGTSKAETSQASPLPVDSYLVNGPYLATGENTCFFQSQPKRCSGLLDTSSGTIKCPRRRSSIRVGKGRNHQHKGFYWYLFSMLWNIFQQYRRTMLGYVQHTTAFDHTFPALRDFVPWKLASRRGGHTGNNNYGAVTT